MTSKTTPKFVGGRNIALKVPPHQFDKTIAFYKDVLDLTINDHAIIGDIPLVSRRTPDLNSPRQKDRTIVQAHGSMLV